MKRFFKGVRVRGKYDYLFSTDIKFQVKYKRDSSERCREMDFVEVVRFEGIIFHLEVTRG